MTIRWTQPANDNLLGIVSWIAATNQAAASKVGRFILAAVEQLDDFPFRGKPGRSPDTRELVVPGLPYLVVYGVEPAAQPVLANGGYSPGAARGYAVAVSRGIIPGVSCRAGATQ
jgi:toxin ParE1/3/4